MSDEKTHGSTIIMQIDPTLDYALYSVTLLYKDSAGAQHTFTGKLISTNKPSAAYGYAGGMEYWETTLFNYYLDPKNTPLKLTFSAATGMKWSNTTANPLSQPYQSMGPNSVSWVPYGGSLPQGSWLYRAPFSSYAGAAISLGQSGSTYTVSWGLLSSGQPAAGTNVVPLTGTYFDGSAPGAGPNTWYVPA